MEMKRNTSDDITDALNKLSPHSHELVFDNQEDCAVRLIKGMGLPCFLGTHLSVTEDNPLIGGQFL